MKSCFVALTLLTHLVFVRERNVTCYILTLYGLLVISVVFYENVQTEDL
jgi:hypothetical protein